MVKIYTVKEAAALLSTSKGIIYKLIHEGEIKAIKIGDMKIREDELERYVDRLQQESNLVHQ